MPARRGTEPEVTGEMEPEVTRGTEPEVTRGTEPEVTREMEPEVTREMEPEVTRGTVADRVERDLWGARLRVLIVGAGIAGATLAALMRERGGSVALIERGERVDSGGYMLGLLPLGGRVLNGLGLSSQYRAQSLPMRTYELYDRHGALNRRYELTRLVEHYGDWRGIERGDLLALLRGAAGPIHYGTTVTGLLEAGDADGGEDNDGVTATFSDGSQAHFDVVVAADGIHSATRELVLPSVEVGTFDTGWGGFVMWGPLDEARADTYSEMWSAGWGVGLYPVPGRVGIFLAGRHDAIASREAHEYADEITDRIPEGVLKSVVSGRDRDSGGVYWRMSDCRSRSWSSGHTVLLGDAAAAFLPTAGVGASAAMDSAAALDDELSRADPRHITYALALYERRQRKRVELAQRNSRNLARAMFVGSRTVAFARDELVRFYSEDALLSGISKVMKGS